jgi:hypothetical protein
MKNAWEIIKPIKSNGHHRYLSVGIGLFLRELKQQYFYESKKNDTIADCHFQSELINLIL